MSDKRQCLKTITGPIVKDRGRSRPLWRRQCRNTAEAGSSYCWRHNKKEDQ